MGHFPLDYPAPSRFHNARKGGEGQGEGDYPHPHGDMRFTATWHFHRGAEETGFFYSASWLREKEVNSDFRGKCFLPEEAELNLKAGCSSQKGTCNVGHDWLYII